MNRADLFFNFGQDIIGDIPKDVLNTNDISVLKRSKRLDWWVFLVPKVRSLQISAIIHKST